MRKVCFINGSPRGEGSGSRFYIDELTKLMDTTTSNITHFSVIETVKRNNFKEVFKSLLEMSDIVFVFPLYIDCLPASVLDFVTKFEEFIKENRIRLKDGGVPRVYGLVNNGFIEGYQNKYALRILEHFCERVGLIWRFGVGVGGGEFMAQTAAVPPNSKLKRPVHKAYLAIVKDIENNNNDNKDNILTNPNVSKNMFIFAATINWIKNKKVKIRDMFKKPYKT